jgi:hypothetical protein
MADAADALVPREGNRELAKPVRMVARPVHPLQCHTYDFRVAATQPGPQQLLGERPVDVQKRSLAESAGRFVPAEKGDARNLTGTPSVAERDPARIAQGT